MARPERFELPTFWFVVSCNPYVSVCRSLFVFSLAGFRTHPNISRYAGTYYIYYYIKIHPRVQQCIQSAPCFRSVYRIPRKIVSKRYEPHKH
jgi:hypothetical protein